MNEKTINPLQKRLYISSNLESFISESIYYRSYNKEMLKENRIVIWHFFKEFGKAVVK